MNDNKLRQSRKLEHIHHSINIADGPSKNGFEDIHLIHRCLSNNNFADISLSTTIGTIELDHPIIINAITGGDDEVLNINKKLALAAKKTNTAMAVGSQYAAIKNPLVRKTYEIVRKTNPDGIIFANLGAHATLKEAQEAIDMLEANALQIHLNIAQELTMKEGDRCFSSYLENIQYISSNIDVPVIVKETGNGMGMEDINLLLSTDISAIDISGMGGSNFIAIEAARYQNDLDKQLLSWGIKTAISLIEATQIAFGEKDIIASGGIRTSLDIAKSLSCGANAVSIAGMFLDIIFNNDEDLLCKKINTLLLESKNILLLSGASSINELQKQPLVITGFTKEWLETRGINVYDFCRKKFSY